jgi:hypothetical protein
MTLYLRRFLLMLPLLAAGTVLAAVTIGMLDPSTIAVGFRLVVAVAPPLFAIDRWWRVGVELDVAASAATLISLSFPVLYYGTMLVAAIINPTFQLLGMIVGIKYSDPFWPATMIASAIGARFVAAALARMTKRQDKNLRRAMVLWAACWPLLQYVYPPRAKHFASDASLLEWLFPPHRTWFGPFSILAWQIPIGLACVIWFLRAAPAPTRRPAAAAA